jgi:pectin methylesterase-like acyl-CoA thioesterase
VVQKRLAFALAIGAVVTGCVATQPATDTGNPAGPTGVTSSAPAPATGPLAYTPDMAPVFASDCTPCHSGSRPSGNYSMSTYANVMRAVVPGNAGSALVVTTQPSGSMYRYFSVDRPGRADMVRRWVVDDKAAQTR